MTQMGPIFGRVKEIASIDLRSLAFFRIALGVLLLMDANTRSKYFWEHYSERGILPLDVLAEQLPNASRWSLFRAMDSEWWGYCLLGMLVLSSLCLLIGWRTRLCVFVSWLALASIHGRNPLVLDAGDTILLLLLFWSYFLPLGACFSVDSALGNETTTERKSIRSVASLALLLQIALVYVFTVFHREGPIWWEGHGLRYALNGDLYVSAAGMWLRKFEFVLPAMTYAVLYLELYGPFLAFSPWRNELLRSVVICMFLSLHLGIFVTMTIGIFPLISMASWIPFLPTTFWAKVGAIASKHHEHGLSVYYDADCAFCHKATRLLATLFVLPRVCIHTAQSNREILAELEEHESWVIKDRDARSHYGFDGFVCICRYSPLGRVLAPFMSLAPCRYVGSCAYRFVSKHRHLFGNIFLIIRPARIHLKQSAVASLCCAFLLSLVILWNIRGTQAAVHVPDVVRNGDSIVRALRLNQNWRMFGPYPFTDDGWFVVPARLANGDVVDLFSDGVPVNWEKPELVSSTFVNHRWRRHVSQLRRHEYRFLRPHYANYLAKQWNSSREVDLHVQSLRIYFVFETTYMDRIGEPEPKVLWVHRVEKETDE